MLIAVLALNVWYLSSLTIEHRVIPTTYDYIINAIVVISAAFFGSYSAYFLSDKKEQTREYNKKINSLNSALFVTLRQFNALMVIKRELVKWENDPSRFINMPPRVNSSYSDLKIDLHGIDFLLRESNPNLLLELAVEQERFESAIMACSMRNDFHYKELQPALNAINFNIQNPTIQQLETAVGPKIAGTALKSTENVFSHVYLTHDSLSKIHSQLYKTAKELFPNETFIIFEPHA